MRRSHRSGRNAIEVRRLLEEHIRSGLTRRQFCEQVGIPVTTLDYYRRRESEHRQADLLPVTVLPSVSSGGFTIVLGNGRRIESQWEFPEAALSRLVQRLEQV